MDRRNDIDISKSFGDAFMHILHYNYVDIISSFCPLGDKQVISSTCESLLR